MTDGTTDGYIGELRAEIEQLRDYSCHKWSCARIGNAALKCTCGLAELLGGNYVEEIPNTGPIVPKVGKTMTTKCSCGADCDLSDESCQGYIKIVGTDSQDNFVHSCRTHRDALWAKIPGDHRMEPKDWNRPGPD